MKLAIWDWFYCIWIPLNQLLPLVLIPAHIKGILPKGPYPPCWHKADRAILAGYPGHPTMQSTYRGSTRREFSLHTTPCNSGSGSPCDHTTHGSRAACPDSLTLWVQRDAGWHRSSSTSIGTCDKGQRSRNKGQRVTMMTEHMWWGHHIEMLTALLAFCKRNSQVNSLIKSRYSRLLLSRASWEPKFASAS